MMKNLRLFAAKGAIFAFFFMASLAYAQVQGGVAGGSGTGNSFFRVTGPATTIKTFTFPNASSTVLTSNDVTGTGSAVLANTPTLIAPLLGTPTSGVATNLTGTAAGLTAGAATALATGRTINGTTFDGTANIITNVLQNSQSTAYTTVLSDNSKQILHPLTDNNARTFTIDSNANVAYPIGAAITFVNLVNTVTIAITTDTMYLCGAGTTGSRTLAAFAIATALKVGTTAWVICGNGLT